MDTAVETYQLERHLVLEGLGGWHFRKRNCVLSHSLLGK